MSWDRITFGHGTLVGFLLVTIGVALRIAALGIIPGNRKPSTGMAWLLLVMLSPTIGLIAFSVFGSARLGRRRDFRQQRRVARLIGERPCQHEREVGPAEQQRPQVRGERPDQPDLAAHRACERHDGPAPSGDPAQITHEPPAGSTLQSAASLHS